MLMNDRSRPNYLLDGVSGRSQALDLVRFLALSLVVAGHVWLDKPLSDYVAIFFMVTGYLWKDDRKVSQEASHKWTTLLRPYMAWGLILAALTIAGMLVRGDGLQPVAQKSVELLWGGKYATEPFNAYWFLSAMLFACVIYRAVYNFRSTSALVGIGVASFLGASVFGNELTILPFALGQGLWAIQFISAGHLLQRVEKHLMKSWLWGLFFAFGGLSLIVFGGVDKLVLKHGIHGTPFLSVIAVILVSSGAIVLAQSLERLLPQSLLNWFTVLVMTSTPVILLHGLPLRVFRGSLPDPILFAIALGAPIAAGMILLGFGGRIRAWFMPGKARWAFVRHKYADGRG